jgi:DNA-directed RNA polymerase specialized sigma54-like protein
MARGKIRNKLNDVALVTIVNSIRNSGMVLNVSAIADLAGVHKGTVSRRLRSLGIFPEGRAVESSTDKEPRTWAEIARLIRLAIARENRAKPLSDTKLVVTCGLACDWQIVRAVRWRYNIPNSRERKKIYTGR